MRNSKAVRADRSDAAPRPSKVDTSLLLQELKKEYEKRRSPIEVNFREMVNWVRPGDQLTHFIHPYPAKLLPHIANFFASASALRRDGSSILDPFAGSGTVALEGSMVGLTPLIADSNPLALLVTRVKTTPYDPSVLLECIRALVTRTSRLRAAPSIPIVNEHIWYRPRIKSELERILRAVTEVEDDSVRDFFQVCFSVVARRLSNADMSISVPVRLKVKPSLSDEANREVRRHIKWLNSVDALEEFAKTAHLNVARIATTNDRYPSRVSATPVGHDARSLVDESGNRLASNSVPLVVTSPPYGSAQKYIRASSLSLNWLSLCPPRGLANLESRSIGREHLARSREGAQVHAKEDNRLSDTLDTIRQVNAARAAITETYLREMRDALREIVRVTAPKGHVALVIGNNRVSGVTVKNDEFAAELLQENGCDVNLVLRDRIHSRGLLTQRNATAGVIARETIMLFQKRG